MVLPVAPTLRRRTSESIDRLGLDGAKARSISRTPTCLGRWMSAYEYSWAMKIQLARAKMKSESA